MRIHERSINAIMKILNIETAEFAGLGARSFTFCEGFNIIEGENESGKSSLLSFIKFILYGLGRRGTGGDISERDRYLSWSGRRAAGSMTVHSGGKLWRIERELFVQTRGTRESHIENQKIIDLETGAEDHSGKCPGELFLGIPESVFTSTCLVAQTNLSGINTADVGNAIENLLLSANENLNADKSADILDRARKTLLYKNGNGGRLFDLRSERSVIKTKLNAAATNTRNIMAKEALAAEYKRQEDESRRALEELEQTWEASEILHSLERFNSLRALESQRDELKKALSELEEDSFPNGFKPDRSFPAKLTYLARELTAAEAALTRADSELSRIENTVPYSEEKLKMAKMLGEYGISGSESVLISYRTLKSAAAVPGRFITLFLILVGVFAAAAAALVALSVFIAGIVAAALGIAAGAAAVAAVISAGKKKLALSDYMLKFNFDSDPGEDELKNYIDGCFAAFEDEKKYTAVLEARRGVAAVCRDKLTSLRAECRAALAMTGTDEGDENLAAALGEDAALTSNFCAARETLLMKLENTENEIGSMKQYLLKYDEPLLRRRAESLPETEMITSETYRRRRTELMLSIKNSEDKKVEIERQLAVFEATADKPARLALLLEEIESHISELELKHSALQLATEALAEASGELRRGVTPKLRKNTGRLLANLSGGRYNEIGIDRDMSLTINTGGTTRPISALSGGTKDAVYISLRIALASLLCPAETPPLLIDEGLSQLDESRAANLISLLMSWCRSEGGQCLLFTCHSREEAIAASLNIPHNHIRLSTSV